MKNLIFVLTLLQFAQFAKTQNFDSLDKIPSEVALIYASPGNQQRGQAIARQINNAYAYYDSLLHFKPSVTLLILDDSDWKKFTTKQAVYGMPHFDAKSKTLFVAATDNPFWKSFIPPLEQLPVHLAKMIFNTYKEPDGNLSMQPFFDLLAIHELGHAFSSQKGIKMQRNWMGELFVNILLHTYIAEREPGLLPALTVFPKMVVAGGSSTFEFTSLADVHNRYDEIASKHPRNYGWYQCRWHAAAAKIYDAAGKDVGKKIWNTFLTVNNTLSDKELVTLMELQVHSSVADLIRNWDAETKTK